MHTRMLAGVVIGGMSLLLLGACNETDPEDPQLAANAPREVCTEEVVTRQKPVKDEDRVLGTVAGALVGGVVGHEVGGKGTSQDVATVGGAVAGGYAGNRIQKSVQDNATEQTTERVCRPVND